MSDFNFDEAIPDPDPLALLFWEAEELSRHAKNCLITKEAVGEEAALRSIAFSLLAIETRLKINQGVVDPMSAPPAQKMPGEE